MDCVDNLPRISATVPERYPCSQCSSVFRGKAFLARHINQQHQPVKAFRCTHCDAAYNLLNNLSIHRTIHTTGNPPFKCPQCNITFRRHAALVGHIEKHYVSEDHICAICDGVFRTLDELKAHVYEGHENGLRRQKNSFRIVPTQHKKDFKCSLCEDKVFSKRSLLERHFLIHTKRKPFAVSFLVTN